MYSKQHSLRNSVSVDSFDTDTSSKISTPSFRGDTLSPMTPLQKLNPLGAHLLQHYYSTGIRNLSSETSQRKIEKPLYILNSPKDIPLIMSCESETETYGMIVTIADRHRVPIIVKGTNVAILESLGDSLDLAKKSIIQIGTSIQKTPGRTFNIYAPSDKRQKDSRSCGTDAFMTMKEALRLDEALFGPLLSSHTPPKKSPKSKQSTPKSNLRSLDYSSVTFRSPDPNSIDPDFQGTVTYTQISLPPELMKLIQDPKLLKSSAAEKSIVVTNSPKKKTTILPDYETVSDYITRQNLAHNTEKLLPHTPRLKSASIASDSATTIPDSISIESNLSLTTLMRDVDTTPSPERETSSLDSMVSIGSMLREVEHHEDSPPTTSSLSSDSYTDELFLQNRDHEWTEKESTMHKPSIRRRAKHLTVTSETLERITEEELNAIIRESSGINLLLKNADKLELLFPSSLSPTSLSSEEIIGRYITEEKHKQFDEVREVLPPSQYNLKDIARAIHNEHQITISTQSASNLHVATEEFSAPALKTSYSPTISTKKSVNKLPNLRNWSENASDIRKPIARAIDPTLKDTQEDVTRSLTTFKNHDKAQSFRERLRKSIDNSSLDFVPKR